MKLKLGTAFDGFIAELVASGLYRSEDEVLREALRLLKEKEERRLLKLEELRREIAIGIEQADRGELTPLDIGEIKSEIRKQFNPSLAQEA